MELVLHDLGFADGQVAEFATDQPQVMDMEIKQPLPGEATQLTGRQCLCTVRTEEAVSDKVISQFEQALDAELEFAGRDSVGPQTSPTPPQAVREIAQRVSERMGEFARRVAKLIRWRTEFPGRHYPIHSAKGGMQWSVSGEEWKRVPGGFRSVSLAGGGYSKPDEAMLAEVKGMLASGLREPLAHELLHEGIS
jgi:hypothetical protein